MRDTHRRLERMATRADVQTLGVTRATQRGMTKHSRDLSNCGPKAVRAVAVPPQHLPTSRKTQSTTIARPPLETLSCLGTSVGQNPQPSFNARPGLRTAKFPLPHDTHVITAHRAAPPRVLATYPHNLFGPTAPGFLANTWHIRPNVAPPDDDPRIHTQDLTLRLGAPWPDK